jgi:hypothetical protein
VKPKGTPVAALEELRRMVPPPGEPRLTEVNWGAVRSRFGFRPPEDYRAFIESYGAGSIDDILWIHHPTTADEHRNLGWWLDTVTEALGAIRQELPEEVPFPLWPEPGGLIPWGITDDGASCYWRSSDADPDRWTVVVGEARGPRWHKHTGSMTEFVCDVLTGREHCDLLSEGWPQQAHQFVPDRRRAKP